MAKDKRGNTFYVVRKGMRSDLDSYGIATENDGISVTPAPALFRSLAQTLKEKGVTKALVSAGGWATNYCLEFSHKDIWKYLVTALREQSIQTHVQLLTDLCRGIPTPTLPDAFARMAAMGSTLTTSASYLAANRCKKAFPEPA